MIEVYTDGSCLGNPGKGGWAVVFPNREIIHGSAPDTTNNRMELLAVVQAIEHTRRESETLKIYSDSMYAVQILQLWLEKWKNNGWKTVTGRKVANKDLLVRLSNSLAGREVITEHVKGHSDNKFNETADIAARIAAERQL